MIYWVVRIQLPISMLFLAVPLLDSVQKLVTVICGYVAFSDILASEYICNKKGQVREVNPLL
jgi:hypothetical protein